MRPGNPGDAGESSPFRDDAGLIFSQNFIALWPEPDWPITVLSAVLNGPLASAYVAAHETTKHQKVGTFEGVPLPALNAAQKATIHTLVTDYIQERKEWAFGSRPSEGLLLKIDAEVLRCYGLPPQLERAVLDFFRGSDRPVDHPFGGYFPESFGPRIPLWRFLARNYGRLNAGHFLENIPNIDDDPELADALAEVE